MKLLKWFLLALYITGVVYVVFLAKRRQALVWHDDLVNVIPLKKTVEAYLSSTTGTWNFFSNLYGNVLLFIPLPFFLMSIFRIYNRTAIIFTGLFISVLIELVQYAWRIGVPDIDDVLLNVMGVWLGIYLWKNIVKSSSSQKFF